MTVVNGYWAHVRDGWGTRRLYGHFSGMMYERIASAAVGMASVVLLGAGLGGYTVRGFNMREPIDVIGDKAAHVRAEHFSPAQVAPAPIQHVCKGCDAQLHGDDEWPRAGELYDPEDEWAQQEGEKDDAARLARADDPRAAYRRHAGNGEADVVVDKDLVLDAGASVSQLDR